MFRIYITNNITYNKTNDIIASIITRTIVKMVFKSNLDFAINTPLFITIIA